MTGALHVHVRFTCVIYFSKTLILLSKSTYPVSNVIHIILRSGTQGDRTFKHRRYTSLVGKKRKSGMSISLKTEWLQRTQLMTGVNRRRIWSVLRDIKYYKIITGNSVLIRGEKSKKKK